METPKVNKNNHSTTPLKVMAQRSIPMDGSANSGSCSHGCGKNWALQAQADTQQQPWDCSGTGGTHWHRVAHSSTVQFPGAWGIGITIPCLRWPWQHMGTENRLQLRAGTWGAHGQQAWGRGTAQSQLAGDARGSRQLVLGQHTVQHSGGTAVVGAALLLLPSERTEKAASVEGEVKMSTDWSRMRQLAPNMIHSFLPHNACAVWNHVKMAPWRASSAVQKQLNQKKAKGGKRWSSKMSKASSVTLKNTLQTEANTGIMLGDVRSQKKAMATEAVGRKGSKVWGSYRMSFLLKKTLCL